MTEGFKPSTAPAQQSEGRGNVMHREPQGVGIADSPFLTVSEAARFCRFDDCANPEIAFRQWARRAAIPAKRRGRRVLLFDRAVLAKFLVSA